MDFLDYLVTGSLVSGLVVEGVEGEKQDSRFFVGVVGL